MHPSRLVDTDGQVRRMCAACVRVCVCVCVCVCVLLTLRSSSSALDHVLLCLTLHTAPGAPHYQVPVLQGQLVQCHVCSGAHHDHVQRM